MDISLHTIINMVSTRILILLQYICSYVLYPLAFFMGVETDDCRRVAELIGLKTFLNEFVAYDELGKLITCVTSSRA